MHRQTPVGQFKHGVGQLQRMHVRCALQRALERHTNHQRATLGVGQTHRVPCQFRRADITAQQHGVRPRRGEQVREVQIGHVRDTVTCGNPHPGPSAVR